MKKMTAQKAKTVHLMFLVLLVETAFDELVDLIRAAHRESALPSLVYEERLLGKRSQDHREIAGITGGSGSKAT
jgi:hypothetical protein